MVSEQSEPENTGEEQVGSTKFAAGQSGNPAGRPKGSRNKLGEAFVSALHADFQEHGVDVIARVRLEKPDQYLKVVASLLPKEIKIEAVNDLSDGQLDQRIKQLLAALAELGLEDGASGTTLGTQAPAGSQQAGSVPTVQ
jgi:hypothetical protein